MKMMRVTEAVEALGGRLSKRVLYYGLQTGRYRGCQIGHAVCIDVDSIPPEDLRAGLVNKTELCRVTGMTPYLVDMGVQDGWIISQRCGARSYYDVTAVLEALEKRMKGGVERGRKAAKGRAK